MPYARKNHDSVERSEHSYGDNLDLLLLLKEEDGRKPHRTTLLNDEMTRFIHNAFHEQLSAFQEYNRKGYNRKGLDLDVLSQMENMLQKISSDDMTPGLQKLKHHAEIYLQTLKREEFPAKASPVLKDTLNQANKMAATICTALNALSVAGRVGGKDWAEKVDEKVSEQLNVIAGEAVERLNENITLPVSSEYHAQTKNRLMGLMFSNSNQFTAENEKFKLYKKSLLAEERVSRNNLAAWMVRMATQIRNESRDTINWANDEPVAMRIAGVIHQMNTELRQTAKMLQLHARDLGSEKEKPTEAYQDWVAIKKIPGKVVNIKESIYGATKHLKNSTKGVSNRLYYKLDEKYGVQSDRGKSAVKNTGLLLLDELYQSEYWLKQFPTVAWELEESVEQLESVRTKAIQSDHAPVLSALLDEKLGEEAVRWEEKCQQAEKKLTTLVSSATRLTPEVWVDDFWSTISAAFGQKDISAEEREWLLVFRDDMKDIVKSYANIAADIGASTVRLALHGHAGGQDLNKKLQHWLRELNLLKGKVSTGILRVTGEDVTYYSHKGMLARGMAQWGMDLKQDYLQATNSECDRSAAAEFDEHLITILQYNAGYFTKESDLKDALFLQRLMLELKHAEQHTTTFPQTPEEILAETRSVPDDLKHWAQQKVASGLIDAIIRGGVKVFTRPFSLPGRILWRIVRRGYSLYRGLEGINKGVKYGEGPATRIKERFIKNVIYKEVLRVGLSLSPATALGVAGVVTIVRLATEDDYLKKFITDTVAGLPEDMLWRAGGAGTSLVYQAILPQSTAKPVKGRDLLTDKNKIVHPDDNIGQIAYDGDRKSHRIKRSLAEPETSTTLTDFEKSFDLRKYHELPDDAKKSTYSYGIKYLLRNIENDTNLPEKARNNAYLARIGAPVLVPVNLHRYKINNTFFIPDYLGSKSGVLVKPNGEEPYRYVTKGSDLPESLKYDLPHNAEDKIYFLMSGSTKEQYWNNGFDVLDGLRSGGWNFERNFNSDNPDGVGINELAKQLSESMEEDYKHRPEKITNINLIKRAIVGSEIPEPDVSATPVKYKLEVTAENLTPAEFKRSFAHPFSKLAGQMSLVASAREGESIQQAEAHAEEAEQIGAWVDVSVGAVTSFTPAGMVIGTAQSIADISADVDEGKDPDPLAVAGVVLSCIPAGKVSARIGKVSAIGGKVTKYTLMVGNKAVDLAITGRSIKLAVESGKPLAIYQALLASGMSAKNSHDISNDMFSKLKTRPPRR